MSVRTNSSKFTKSSINEYQGDIPVYGACKDENIVYGKIKDNLSFIKYFENCLTWNTNGSSSGKVFFRQGKFSLSVDVSPLIIREIYKDKFFLPYLKYAVEKELIKQDFGFANKAGKDKIKNIEIKIPTTPQGKFDLVKQKEIAEK